MRKLAICSGSTCRSKLDVGSKVMSWSMNWPRNVIPAVIWGLLALLADNSGLVISAWGSERLSLASMMPPGRPISSNAARTCGVSAAKGGSLPNIRPNRPESK